MYRRWNRPSNLNSELTTLPLNANTYTVTQKYGQTSYSTFNDTIDMDAYFDALIHAAGDGLVYDVGQGILATNGYVESIYDANQINSDINDKCNINKQ